MSKTQSPRNSNSNAFFFIAATVIIIITFLLFTPRIAATLFPFKRQAVFNDFIQKVKKDKAISPQEYWEFREFYSPGFFTVSKKGIAKPYLQQTEKAIGIPLKEGAIQLPFAIFNSSKLTSLDALSEKGSLVDVAKRTNPSNIIFTNSSSLIYKEGDKIVKIIFVMPENEMRKAVGFFEYNDADKKITQGKHWLNITTLTLD